MTHITSGSSSCADDRTLAARAFEPQVGGGGSGARRSLHLFVFGNAAAWESGAASVDACRATWPVSPYRAFAEKRKVVVADAIEAALRDAAVSGTGE